MSLVLNYTVYFNIKSGIVFLLTDMVVLAYLVVVLVLDLILLKLLDTLG